MSNALKFSNAIGLAKLASAPSNPENGYMYYDTVLNKVRVYEDGAFVDAAVDVTTIETDIADLQDETQALLNASNVAAVSTTNISSLSGLPIIDGYQTLDADLVLLAGQSSNVENGIWIVGSGSWTRYRAGELLARGAFVRVFSGDTHTNSTWKQNGFGFYTNDGSVSNSWSKIGQNYDSRLTSIEGDIAGALQADGSVVMTGDLDANSNKIVNLADPTSDQDAATKAYVDDSIAALPDPIVYQGTWDASTNTPTLDNTDTGVAGYLYQVNVAGSVDFGAGSISFEVGDKVVNNGTAWEKWDMTDAVTSVNGQSGAVVLELNDIDDVDTTGVADGDVLTYDNGVWISTTPAATGANTTLSNLGTTSINADLLPSAANTRDIGSTTLPFNDIYSNNFRTRASTGQDTGLIYGQNDGQLDVSAQNGILRLQANSGSSQIQMTGSNVARGKNTTTSQMIEEEYFHSVALTGSQTNTVITTFNVSTASFEGMEITYKLKEDTSNDIRIGTFRVTSNGTDISFSDVFVETNDTGITFDAVMSGANINVRYSSGTNGATMRADVKRFRI